MTVEVSPIPKARKKVNDDERLRPLAAKVYRGIRDSENGLSWRECFALTDSQEQAGVLVTWLRAHGVSVLAVYFEGETRFVLGPSLVPTPEEPSQPRGTQESASTG